MNLLKRGTEERGEEEEKLTLEKKMAPNILTHLYYPLTRSVHLSSEALINHHKVEPLWMAGFLISSLYFINTFHTLSIQYIQSFMLSCFEFLMLVVFILTVQIRVYKVLLTEGKNI